MILAESAGWEADVDASNHFGRRGLAGQLEHRRPENRIAALGLGIEEEALELLPQARLDGSWQIPQNVRRRSASDQDDLDPLRRSLDDELEVSEGAAMGSICVGRDTGLANGLANFEGRFIDQRMMDRAVGCMNDSVAAGLKEPDLGIPGVPAHCQTCAMAMATTRGSVDRGLWKTRGLCDLEEARPRLLGQAAGAEARAARAGRSMRAVFSSTHSPSLACGIGKFGALLPWVDAGVTNPKTKDPRRAFA